MLLVDDVVASSFPTVHNNVLSLFPANGAVGVPRGIFEFYVQFQNPVTRGSLGSVLFKRTADNFTLYEVVTAASLIFKVRVCCLLRVSISVLITCRPTTLLLFAWSPQQA